MDRGSSLNHYKNYQIHQFFSTCSRLESWTKLYEAALLKREEKDKKDSERIETNFQEMREESLKALYDRQQIRAIIATQEKNLRMLSDTVLNLEKAVDVKRK